MSDHPTCKTCKHWWRNQGGNSRGDVDYCCHPNIDPYKWIESGAAAHVLHESEYLTPLLMHADFGCIHHPELNTDAIEDDGSGA